LQLRLRGVPRAERRRRSAELLAAVGLDGASEMLPGRLSGGEQQRVAVCAALAHRPRVLLADEPSGELDRTNADVVYRLIRDLALAEGTTAVIVSHDDGATAIADRTVRIRDGRLSEEWRAGHPSLVVGHGGWVHLPEDLRERFGITTHVRAEAGPDGIVLVPDADRAALPPPPPAAPGVPGERVAELAAVSKAYDRAIFDDLHVGFHRGVMSAVIGRSGSGKSTLLAMLAGLERPDAGEVRVLGHPLSELDRAGLARLRRSAVAYVGQEPGLVGFLSAAENVAFTLTLRGVDERTADERARVALSQIGLGARLDQHASRLSAGERQRVAIARALATGADVVLMDEPTSRLDQANAEAVAGLLAEAAAARDAAVVCATHDPLLVEAAGRRLVLDEPLGVAAPAAPGGAGR
jgi:ABC-type lipoprotein export system ATPase subunit